MHYNQNRDRAKKTLSSLSGSNHILLQADLTDANAAQRLVETVVEKTGRLDVLVNNTGVYLLHRVAEINYDDWQAVWQKTLATNLLAPANLIFWAAKQMTKQGGGKSSTCLRGGRFAASRKHRPTAPAKPDSTP